MLCTSTCSKAEYFPQPGGNHEAVSRDCSNTAVRHGSLQTKADAQVVGQG